MIRSGAIDCYFLQGFDFIVLVYHIRHTQAKKATQQGVRAYLYGCPRAKGKNHDMNPVFFILFILFPIVEIIVFFNVGDEIGFFLAFFLILLGGFCGVALMRAEGMRTLLTLNGTIRAGRMPEEDMFNSLCVVTAGLLIALPGFVSDVIGILLLLAPVRTRLRAALATKTKPTADSSVLEGEFERTDD
jgi:UPF0716 protein FxsA